MPTPQTRLYTYLYMSGHMQALRQPQQVSDVTGLPRWTLRCCSLADSRFHSRSPLDITPSRALARCLTEWREGYGSAPILPCCRPFTSRLKATCRPRGKLSSRRHGPLSCRSLCRPCHLVIDSLMSRRSLGVYNHIHLELSLIHI